MAACVTPTSPSRDDLDIASPAGAAPVLFSITITPAKPSVAVGAAKQLTATGVYSDSSTMDLTAQVKWGTSAPGIAVPSFSGVLQGIAAGSATITAKLGTVQGSTTATVTQATLVEIQVMPANPSLAAGTTQQLTATAVFNDKTTQDVTAQVAWSSDGPAHATVSAGGLVSALAVGGAQIRATKGAISGTAQVTVTPAALVSLQVTPIQPSLALGRTQAFAATGTFTDGTIQDLTAQVAWASSAPAIATISNAPGSAGVATAVGVGATAISAALGGVTGTTTLTVTPAVLDAIAVTPTGASLAQGRTQAYAALGAFSDGTAQDLTAQVTWQTADPAIAVISNAAGSQGLATALAVGTTTVSATLDGVTGTASLTVTQAVLDSIAVAPAVVSLPKGHRQQLAALGTFSDGSVQDLTAQVTWISASPGVAAVSNADGSRGLVAALAIGATTISAALDGVTGTAAVAVTAVTLDSIAVTPAIATTVPGGSLGFVAFGTFSDASTMELTTQVTWASSDVAVAQISNAATTHGRATGLAVGTTQITATLGGVVGTASLVVAGLGVVAIAPPDGAIGAASSVPIVVTFNEAIAAASLTTQRRTGACTGSLQLSADNFASCLAFEFRGPVLSAGNTVATAAPASALQVGQTYRVRVRGTVTNAAGVPLGADVTQATGFTIAVPGCNVERMFDGTCAGI
ncbi:MAG TPA: Ig-like domain-containing protein [Kofleriaceae bacterium]|nr:Ig-like domain-containing protein [Kofleriaceae bacterium]